MKGLLGLAVLAVCTWVGCEWSYKLGQVDGACSAIGMVAAANPGVNLGQGEMLKACNSGEAR